MSIQAHRLGKDTVLDNLNGIICETIKAQGDGYEVDEIIVRFCLPCYAEHGCPPARC